MSHRSLCFLLSCIHCLSGCASDPKKAALAESGGTAGSATTWSSSAGQSGAITATGGQGGTTVTAAGATSSAGQSNATLPDGSRCDAAPSDATGASEAWQAFLTWHAQTAPGCGVSDHWPSYACTSRFLDPRRIGDFTQCMMSDGCNTVSEEDGCYINPPTIPAKGLPGNPYLAWLEGACFPRSTECGFSDDNCVLVARTVYRPELRCRVRDCLEKSCSEIEACISAAIADYSACD